MENRVLIINNDFIENAKEILFKHRVKFREAKRFTLTEKYESKMIKKESKFSAQKDHNNRVKFAKQLDCKDISEAIVKCGSGAAFNRRFQNEFVQ